MQENEALQLQIRHLQNQLSQRTLDCNTEKVAKRAVQRELDSLRLLLKSIQNEKYLNWSYDFQNQNRTEKFEASSTNPFENDQDDDESLTVYDDIILNFLKRAEKHLDALECTLARFVPTRTEQTVSLQSGDHFVRILVAHLADLALRWRCVAA